MICLRLCCETFRMHRSDATSFGYEVWCDFRCSFSLLSADALQQPYNRRKFSPYCIFFIIQVTNMSVDQSLVTAIQEFLLLISFGAAYVCIHTPLVLSHR